MKYPDLLSKICKDDDKIVIGSSALGLYTFLIYKWYENKCQDFIISDVQVSVKLDLSINTLRALKRRLMSYNLIEFEVRSGLPCSYTILTNTTTVKSVKASVKNAERKRKDNSKPKNAKRTSNQSTSVNSSSHKSKFLITMENSTIPSFDEFLSHAKTLKNYKAEAESKLEKKYNYWVDNGWNNDYNRPIIDWKMFLKSMMQYIIDSTDTEDKFKKIPSIKPPNTK